jgi:CBS domain-containing protein
MNIKSIKLFNELRKSPSSKVKSPDENKVEFEDVLDKEKEGPQKNFHSEEEHEKAEGKSHAIRSYQKQGDKKERNTKLLHARDVYTRPVQTIHPTTSVREALELMEKYRFHHLPILNNEKKIVGILSDRDLSGKRSSDRVERHMRKEVITAKESTEVAHLAREMIRHGIGCLPILNSEDKVVGIVSKTDLLECLANSMPLSQYV